MAQMKMQKNLYFLCFFSAQILAPAALHMASALRAPLAKIVKQTISFIDFGLFPKIRFEAP